MGTNYPGGLDDFAGTSPTYMADDDITGRTHPERHDDVEKALEAVETELGVNPSGAATDVAARFTALDSTVSAKALDNAVVKLSGDQTVSGIKTWNSRQHFHAPIQVYIASADPANPETGDIYYNDQINQIKYYDGSGWDTVMCLQDAQTITGTKTFSTNPVFNDAGIPQAKVANLTTDLAARLVTEDSRNLTNILRATSGTWAPVTTASQMLCGTLENSTAAQNDYVEWDTAPLLGGTWSLRFAHISGSNRGIYTVSIDGTSIGTVDGYNSTNVYNIFSTIAGITLTDGRHKVRFTMATKNASSSAYKASFSTWSLLRTGA